MTTSRYSPARFLPAGVKSRPPKRAGLSLPVAHCEKCGDPLPEAKYHDCGEHLSILDAISEAEA